MGGVGHGLTDGPVAFVVEVEDEPWIPPPGLRARHLLGAVATPEPVGTAERLGPEEHHGFSTPHQPSS